jgi:8-oxo-dGTP diphosphatase
VVSVAHFALIPAAGVELKTTEKYADIRWQSANRPLKAAYDHEEIGRVALERLRSRIGYSNIAWSVLPEKFSLSELQAIYEAILDHPLDKRNFRKRILAAGLLKPSGRRIGDRHRPAQLYRFVRN